MACGAVAEELRARRRTAWKRHRARVRMAEHPERPGGGMKMSTFKCSKCGATADGRCKPKACPKCGSEGTMTKQG